MRACLFALFALIGCDPSTGPLVVDAGSTVDAAEPPDARPPADIELRVSWDAPIGPTGRLIGWNIGRGTLYGPPDSPTHPEWRTPRRTEALALMRDLRAATGERPYMRFSGLQIDGALGNPGYHFWDYADPERVLSDDDNMAAFEYFQLFDEVDAEPIIMVNFGTGTAREAGDYIRHLVGTNTDDPLVAARAHWGREAPYPVRIVELGNEVYAPWNTGYHAIRNGYAAEGNDPDWLDRPSKNAADYAARALTYLEAIQAELPTAVFWVPLSQADMAAWGGTAQALADLEPLLVNPAVQAVVVHHYHVDDTAEFGGAPKNDPAVMMMLSERYRPLYLELRALLGAVPRDEPLQIAITEYHVAGAFARGQFMHGETAALGLGMADMLISYAQLGIEHLCEHMALNYTAGDDPDRDQLFEPWYPPFREVAPDAPLAPRANAVVKDLMARHVRAERAAVEVVRGPSVAGSGGDWPAVHAAAFRDADEGTLVMLHRETGQENAVEVALPAGYRIERVEAFAPPAIDSTAVTLSTPLEWREDGDTLRFVAPPHSVIAVSASRR